MYSVAAGFLKYVEVLKLQKPVKRKGYKFKTVSLLKLIWVLEDQFNILNVFKECAIY